MFRVVNCEILGGITFFLYSGKCCTQAAASRFCFVIGCFHANYALTNEICTDIVTGIFPGAHPLAVASTVGSEQGDPLAGELSFTV